MKEFLNEYLNEFLKKSLDESQEKLLKEFREKEEVPGGIDVEITDGNSEGAPGEILEEILGGIPTKSWRDL